MFVLKIRKIKNKSFDEMIDNVLNQMTEVLNFHNVKVLIDSKAVEITAMPQKMQNFNEKENLRFAEVFMTRTVDINNNSLDNASDLSDIEAKLLKFIKSSKELMEL